MATGGNRAEINSKLSTNAKSAANLPLLINPIAPEARPARWAPRFPSQLPTQTALPSHNRSSSLIQEASEALTLTHSLTHSPQMAKQMALIILLCSNLLIGTYLQTQQSRHQCLSNVAQHRCPRRQPHPLTDRAVVARRRRSSSRICR